MKFLIIRWLKTHCGFLTRATLSFWSFCWIYARNFEAMKCKINSQKVFSLGLSFLWCQSWNPFSFFLIIYFFGHAAGSRLPEWPSGLQLPGSRLLWKEVGVASERMWGSPVFLSLFMFVCFLGFQGLCNSPGLWKSCCLATVVAVIRSKHIHEASRTVESSESKNTRQVCSKKREKKPIRGQFLFPLSHILAAQPLQAKVSG